MVFSANFRDNLYLIFIQFTAQGPALYHYGACTNVGNVRDNKEDSLVCDEGRGLWIVADGMGGLGFGEVASAITTYTVTRMIRAGHGVNQAIEVAHKNIKDYAETDGLGTNMGTTIVLLLSQGSLYNIFWVGDSRAYLLDNHEMKQVTVDHSLVQSLIEQGELTREQAESDPRRNAVTRALGVQELDTVRADSISDKWQPGQKILLCSDGLTDCVSDEDIESIMRGNKPDQEIAEVLIETALAGGGKDNVTVIVISAPATAKTADMDTHVPGAAQTDDTQIPGNDDTQRPKADTNSSRKEADESDFDAPADDPAYRQLTLPIDASSSPRKASTALLAGDNFPLLDFSGTADADHTLSQAEVGNRPWTWVNALLASAASLLLFLIFVTTETRTPTDTLSSRFVGEELRPVKPIQRSFPVFDMSEPGPMVQVGIFRQLEGAESKLGELTKLGLSPSVLKRETDEGTLYAIVIRASGEEDYQQMLATLQANDLRFFHTEPPGRGS